MTGDFQARASIQGDAFEVHVGAALERGGWLLKERKARVTDLLLEVDYIALDPDGVEWWIECKGSWESTQNGTRRSDTSKKAIATAALLSTCPDRAPYLLITSDLPAEGSVGARSFARALEMGWFTRIMELPIAAIGSVL